MRLWRSLTAVRLSGEDARVVVRGDRGVPGDAGRSLSLLL